MKKVLLYIMAIITPWLGLLLYIAVTFLVQGGEETDFVNNLQSNLNSSREQIKLADLVDFEFDKVCYLDDADIYGEADRQNVQELFGAENKANIKLPDFNTLSFIRGLSFSRNGQIVKFMSFKRFSWEFPMFKEVEIALDNESFHFFIKSRDLQTNCVISDDAIFRLGVRESKAFDLIREVIFDIRG